MSMGREPALAVYEGMRVGCAVAGKPMERLRGGGRRIAAAVQRGFPAGGALCGTAVIAGLRSRAPLHWVAFPEAVIAIAAIGSLAFPRAVSGSMRKGCKGP